MSEIFDQSIETGTYLINRYSNPKKSDIGDKINLSQTNKLVKDIQKLESTVRQQRKKIKSLDQKIDSLRTVNIYFDERLAILEKNL